jgi:hypothetical protein
MTTKKTTPTPATAANNVMKIAGKPEDHGRLVADLTVEGLLTSAVILRSYSAPVGGDIGITEAVQSLRRTVAAVNGGDLRSAETILVGQAGALNAIFAELARRAAANMGEYPDAFERYMRLALKAQGQARATLETLANIKNPPVVFAKQANINNGGQQQVVNGTVPQSAEGSRARAFSGAAAPAGIPESPKSELLESDHGTRLDTRAQSAAGGADPHLAPVGAVNRPAHG